MTDPKGSSTAFDWSGFKSDVWSATTIGDSVAGVVVDLAVRDGRSGPVPVVAIQLDDGSARAIWCGAVDLRKKVADAAPQIGDRLSVVYVADRHVGQPSPMKEFAVEVRRATDEEPF